jgi:hypothetical protein
MYLTNKYTKWYKNIVAHAQLEVNTRSGYLERHHIIPKSIGGSNDAENLVYLTPKEHYICHLLLTKMVTSEFKHKMWYAHYMMMRGKNRYRPSARMYDLAKRNLSAANKLRPGPNLGKPMAAETKIKLSIALTGRIFAPRTADHSSKLGKYERTPEHRLAVSNARKAQTGLQKRSADTKARMSEWQVGVPKSKVACEHCGKESSQMNYSRWHGDKCKTLR